VLDGNTLIDFVALTLNKSTSSGAEKSQIKRVLLKEEFQSPPVKKEEEEKSSTEDTALLQ